ncbi:MAG: methyltransferase [Methyloprofundus sp.]|nr:methyltransferase [Methyloprofundus sp.]
MNTQMQVALGNYKLHRFPIEKDEKLQAWDAADEFLLNDVAEKLTQFDAPRILIINDSFGALAVALSQFKPSALSDSYLAQLSTVENLKLNKIESAEVELYSSLEVPQKSFDFILIKAPKTVAFLEDILARLQSVMTENTEVITAGMVKNMPASIWKTIDKLVGETVPSKAVKKARLIYATPDLSKNTLNNYPSYFALENTDYQICNHSNVFSRQSLDIGTRFFLSELPRNNKYQQVVDLGCGNGVVGLVFAEKNPQAQLHFIDESFMAVASAKENFQQAKTQQEASFQAGDALTNFADHSMDLILCNPPFHQQNAIGSHIAMRMFKQAKQVLRVGGELWVIGNRHLGYQVFLKKYFPKVELIASNAKFILLKASV